MEATIVSNEPEWVTRFDERRKLFAIRCLNRDADGQHFVEYLHGDTLSVVAETAKPMPAAKINIAPDVLVATVAKKLFGVENVDVLSGTKKRRVLKQVKRVAKGKPLRFPDPDKALFKAAVAKLANTAGARKRRPTAALKKRRRVLKIGRQNMAVRKEKT